MYSPSIIALGLITFTDDLYYFYEKVTDVFLITLNQYT